MKNRIVAARQSLTEMRNNKRNPDDIRKEVEGQVRKNIQSISVQQETLQKYFKQLAGLMTKSSIHSTKIELLRLRLEYMENEIADSKRLLVVLRSYNVHSTKSIF